MGQEARYRRLKRLSDGPFPAMTIRYARRYVIDYPDDGVAWIRLGDALAGQARYEEAEQAYAKALEFWSVESRRVPLVCMGRLFEAAGDCDQAAGWYRKAIEIDPGHATAYIYLGRMLASLGRLHEAEEVHRTAVGCTAGCIDEAYLYLGLVLRARERFREAADCFREAIRRDPEYRVARRALRDVEACIRWMGERA